MNHCDICNYKTDFPQNYEKHVKTSKHINNEKKFTHACKQCDNKFSNKKNLDEHEEKCLLKKLNFTEIIIKDLEINNKQLENKNIELENKNKEAENKNKESENKKTESENKNKDLENKIKEFEKKDKEYEFKIKEFEKKDKEYEIKFKEEKRKIQELANKTKELEITLNKCNVSSKRNNISSKRKIFNLENTIIELNTEIKELHLKNEKLNIENQKYLQNLVNSAGNIIESSSNMANSSFNVMKYIIKNFNNAPLLKQLDVNTMYNANDSKYYDDIIYFYNHKQLDEYFGKYIVSNYKKDDTSQQALWNTDGTRFNYIIRTLINDNPNWIIDKNAIEVSKYLIEPLLNIIKTDLNRSILEINKLNNDDDGEIDQDIVIHNLKKVHTLNDIISDIDDNTLKTDILKYITPYLHFDKQKILKQIENVVTK